VRRRCPAAHAERGAVLELGHRHPSAPAVSAVFDDLGVGAVAGVADAALGAAGGDAGVGAAAAGAGTQAGVDRAHLAQPPARARAGQVGRHLPAAGAAWTHHHGVSGVVKGVGQADEHRRAAGIPGDQCVGVVREVLGQLPERNTAGASRRLQRGGNGVRAELGNGGRQRGEHRFAGGAASGGSVLVSGPGHRPSGRRIVVRRTCGAGPLVSPAVLVTWLLTTCTSIRSLG